ncbi:MAG: LL-diaminopimelate aminotransferase [Chloroflexota bacterium]|nr:LL-diaminopimelate aminotransferase [Chloroflexota bacterium]
MRFANRIAKLPPYLFAEVDRRIAAKRQEGMDVISLGIGDPDLPTPQHVIDALAAGAAKPYTHQYPEYEGLPEFREAVAAWYGQRFGVKLDPETQVVSLIGSKEGIAHFPVAVVDPGDVVLATDPGYPVYHTGTLFSDGETYYVPLREENDFLPDLNAIPIDVIKRSKLLWICYPNNPTAAVAPRSFFEECVAFGKEHDLIIAHDAAYTEVCFDGYKPLSFLEVDGAMDVGIEFHSLSKTYNMTGWRIGMAVGNTDIIEALGRVKTNIDSGIFRAVQEAGVVALSETPQAWIDERNAIYQERRDLILDALEGMGLNAQKPKASLYVWSPTPKGISAIDFSVRLLDEAGLVITPGVGFGEAGEGYFRISLACPTDRLKEAMERLASVKV